MNEGNSKRTEAVASEAKGEPPKHKSGCRALWIPDDDQGYGYPCNCGAVFSDDDIRRNDIPRGAYLLLHDLCYDHEGRERFQYRQRAQGILRADSASQPGNCECGHQRKYHNPDTERCTAIVQATGKLGDDWCNCMNFRPASQPGQRCPTCGSADPHIKNFARLFT